MEAMTAVAADVAVDPRWEFSAPRWHDFSSGAPVGDADDGADAWFDTAPDAPKSAPPAGAAAAQMRAPGGRRGAASRFANRQLLMI